MKRNFLFACAVVTIILCGIFAQEINHTIDTYGYGKHVVRSVQQAAETNVVRVGMAVNWQNAEHAKRARFENQRAGAMMSWLSTTSVWRDQELDATVKDIVAQSGIDSDGINRIVALIEATTINAGWDPQSQKRFKAIIESLKKIRC